MGFFSFLFKPHTHLFKVIKTPCNFSEIWAMSFSLSGMRSVGGSNKNCAENGTVGHNMPSSIPQIFAK